TAADGESLLFVNREGGPLGYPNWRSRAWVPACEAANLPGLRFHDLRSTAVSALVAAGVDVKTAQTPPGPLIATSDTRDLRPGDQGSGPIGGRRGGRCVSSAH